MLSSIGCLEASRHRWVMSYFGCFCRLGGSCRGRLCGFRHLVKLRLLWLVWEAQLCRFYQLLLRFCWKRSLWLVCLHLKVSQSLELLFRRLILMKRTICHVPSPGLILILWPPTHMICLHLLLQTVWQNRPSPSWWVYFELSLPQHSKPSLPFRFPSWQLLALSFCCLPF